MRHLFFLVFFSFSFFWKCAALDVTGSGGLDCLSSLRYRFWEVVCVREAKILNGRIDESEVLPVWRWYDVIGERGGVWRQTKLERGESETERANVRQREKKRV